MRRPFAGRMRRLISVKYPLDRAKLNSSPLASATTLFDATPLALCAAQTFWAILERNAETQCLPIVKSRRVNQESYALLSHERRKQLLS
jgi:hypothetical protein